MSTSSIPAAIQANVDAVNKTANATGTIPNTSTTGTTSSLNSLAGDFTNFISLLTTQLKNQDPTSPMETDQFTQELIGFSQVQQQVDQNTNLTKLISATQNANINQSISYVNQLVDANTDSVNLKTGKPIPEMGYTLPSNTTSTTISITDASGNAIRTITGDTSAGRHTISWDGTNDAGSIVTDGTYKIKVTGVGTDGSDVTDVATDVTDYVSSVDFSNGVSTLYFGDIAITTDQIKSIKGYYSQDLSQQVAAQNAADAAAAAGTDTTTTN